MNKNKLYSQELIEKLITLTDSLSELNATIEKIYVLNSDVFENYIEKINFRTERGKLTAEIDISIIKVMMDVICNYIEHAMELSSNLPQLSDNILTEIREV